MKQVILKKGKEINLERKHPWIFSGALHRVDKGLEAGEHVHVVDHTGAVLATGHYHHGSIAVRVLAFEEVELDQDFWNRKVQSAYAYRTSLGLTANIHTNAYRLIHGEGDGIPGLVVDIYNLNAVIQCHSIGVYKDRERIAAAIDTIFGHSLKSIYFKTKDTLPNDYGADVENSYYKEGELSTTIVENDVQFLIDWEGGQKTGFFLDQRQNRRILGSYSKGKSVLNCFCYTGGFSMYALANGSNHVTSIDVSTTATALVRDNTTLNGYTDDQHTVETANVMKALQSEDVPQYDIVIIDPPAFAKSIKKRHNAVQAYKRLNAMALKKVAPGGYLFTFSCSQVVGTELYNNTVTAAAIESGRNIRVVERLTQGPDHPVNIYHPEGSYLKGLILYVE